MKEILKLNTHDILKIQGTYDREVLKEYFNPMSSHRYEDEKEHRTTILRMSKLMCTPVVKFSAILFEIYNEACGYDNPDDLEKVYPNLYPIYKTVHCRDASDRLDYIKEVLSDLRSLNTKIVDTFKSSNRKDKDLEARLVQRYSNWTLESLNQASVEFLYGVYKEIVGINYDDDTDWIEEFWGFYHFRIYKKVLKSKDTYINGTCGRKSVEVITKDSAKDLSPLRVRKYNGEDIEDNQCYIVNTSWGVCNAGTKRWRASQHTVPASTELMDLRTSRYEDGIKLHFDYSQAEVRVMAKLAGEEKLLEAFRQGLDVHQYNASIMWGKPLSEITSQERKAAKGVTFSLLYGKSLPEFAKDFTKGDIKAAQRVFDQFFNAYPKVKEFINKMHVYGSLNGFIPALFGDPIPTQTPEWFYDLTDSEQKSVIDNPYTREVEISPDSELDRIERSKFSKSLRNCQNYGIQNSSSVIAGLCGYQIQKAIEYRNLTAKLECFTHDSFEIDFQARDLLTIFDFLPKTALDYPKEEFDIPMEIDYELGVSNNQLVGLTDIDIDGNSLCANFSSKETSLNLLLDKLRDSDIALQYEIQSQEEEVMSLEEIFKTKRAYASSLGKPYTKVTGNLSMTFN